MDDRIAPPRLKYRLVIFDFDGTLADSFPFFQSVYNGLADKHGLKRIEGDQVALMRSMGTREIMRYIGMPAWKMPVVAKSFIGLMSENAASIALFDGVADTLLALADAGVELAVVSSNSEQNVRRVLGAQLGSLFSHFECGMSVFGKASRIRKVVKQRQVGAGDALYVGDQGTDAEACAKAGVAFGAVAWGYAPAETLRAHRPAEEFESVSAMLAICAAAGAALNTPG
ncbi:HAD hydrolase-like protein [Massilia sp. P8910]|uniref:HAD hydrolase-like protein n=1 Tax=Massilia antarctica TaxID=2765360 RepID=UPI001E34D489|nr:HAD hydrolase-like protein [Massilia antarctica]MCE3603587.1 HAD hydrolase-like protein [Massilia antarctica]